MARAEAPYGGDKYGKNRYNSGDAAWAAILGIVAGGVQLYISD